MEDEKKLNETTEEINDVKNNQEDGTGTQEEEKEKTFSQSQVTKMMTREKNQGRNQILRELGIDPKDAKALEGVKNLIASQKTEEQLVIEREQKANLAIKEAEDRASLAETKVEAMMCGIKPQYVEDAVTLALAKIGEDGDLKSVLAEFKTKYPVWFEESNEDKKDEGKIGQRGTGSSINTNNTLRNSEKGIGSRLAAQKKNANNNHSYWKN